MKPKLWRLCAIITAGLLSGCATDTGSRPALTSPIPDLPAFESINDAYTYAIRSN